MEKIDNPKVFISYAWTDEEYSKKVLSFAKRLIGDGVEVLLDKFEMSPGKELNDFMEKCVKDSSVTNVVVLLNPTYAQRADGKLGGVGKETQIISEEVYNDVDQTKFIPVIFDIEDDNYKSCKPVFFRSRVHVDLTDYETESEEYINLVRILYGSKIHQKPKKGKKPDWVDREPEVTGVTQNIKEFIRKKNYSNLPEKLINDSFDVIIQTLLSDKIFIDDKSWKTDKIYETYQQLTSYRNDYIELVNETCDNENVIDKYLRFFDMLKSQVIDISKLNSMKSDYLLSLSHELIIYTVAILLKKEKYKSINRIVYTPYLRDRYHSEDGLASFREYFYNYSNFDIMLKTFLDNRDSKKYYNGKAHTWMSNIYEKVISKEEFVDADVLLTNLTILNETSDKHPWFALTYVYCEQRHSKVLKIGKSLESKRLASKYYDLFNCSNITALKKQVQRIKDYIDSRTSNLSYSEAFNSIEIITDYISLEKIGILI